MENLSAVKIRSGADVISCNEASNTLFQIQKEREKSEQQKDGSKPVTDETLIGGRRVTSEGERQSDDQEDGRKVVSDDSVTCRRH